MKPLFRPGLNQPGTKLFKGFEPGRRRFLWSPALSAATPKSGAARHNNANALHFAKNLEGMEPGEDAASDPRKS